MMVDYTLLGENLRRACHSSHHARTWTRKSRNLTSLTVKVSNN